jgi:hypothetical protein
MGNLIWAQEAAIQLAVHQLFKLNNVKICSLLSKYGVSISICRHLLPSRPVCTYKKNLNKNVQSTEKKDYSALTIAHIPMIPNSIALTLLPCTGLKSTIAEYIDKAEDYFFPGCM